MKYASVCSGIGAPEMAWQTLGWESVFMSEIEPFPRAVLEQRFGARCARHGAAELPLWGDFTALRVRHLRRLGVELPDLLIAGTPCQSFSVAGGRGSLDDDRGNLTIEFLRLVHAIRRANRSFRWVVWENVPGVLSTKDNAFGCFLAGLVGADAPLRSPLERGRWPNAGMVAGPVGRAAWRVLDAQHFGVPQRRRRVFVVAGFGDRADPAKVLFEPRGVRGDFAAGGEAGEEAAGAITASIGTGGPDDNAAQAGHIIPTVADTITTHEGDASKSESKNYILIQERGVSVNSGPGGKGYRVGGGDKAHVLAEGAVRKLTPVECSRLQGFSDGHTQIAWRGKPASQCPDGPQYRGLGNSMTVPVIHWLGRRIDAVEAGA